MAKSGKPPSAEPHDVIMDGWSKDVFGRELRAQCQAGGESAVAEFT